MKVDVSEVKAYNGCKRQHMFSSRNRFHLTPVETPPQFAFGTMFHEALHALYSGSTVDGVLSWIRNEISTDKEAALLAMIPGYAKEVLPEDLDRFEVKQIEYSFKFLPYPELDDDLYACGSIDMIVVDRETNAVYGFEHKTCKTFRDNAYLWMDEQPRLYYKALQRLVDEWNAELSISETPYTVGGIYLNEVKKLLRQFQYNRVLCTYDEEDLENFMLAFFQKMQAIKRSSEMHINESPNPDWMKCQMCSFKDVCETLMYHAVEKGKLLEQFGSTIKEREEDHLDEKSERMAK